MNALVYVALIGWIPAVLLLYAALPPRRATTVAFIAGWLFLPVARLPIAGLPDYTKTTATTLAALLGTLLFDRSRLAGLRFRWFDLPMLIWCLTPFATALSNGLGVYDGLSSTLNQTATWGLPYVLGRAYFNEAEGLRELAIGLVIGGLVYVPLCLFEVRMSPQLHTMVYGYYPHSGGFAQVKRFGGFRPVVFLSHGLELGMWMSAASLVAYWLWASGAVRRWAELPSGPVLIVLLGTTVLCKSTGALLLLAVGIALLFVTGRTRASVLVWALVLTGPLYVTMRTTGAWSGRGAVSVARDWLGPERAQSLATRLKNEELLAAKALRRPVWGWGGWGRNRVYDEKGRDISITDGLWISSLGKYGLVGLTSLALVILLPVVLLLRRQPVHSWTRPDAAPAAALAVLLALYCVDCLSNGMINPIYLLAAGALTAYEGRGRAREEGATPGASWAERDAPGANGCGVGIRSGEPDAALGDGPASDLDRRVERALEQEALAKSLRNRGSYQEAETAWWEALELWAELAADHPDRAEFRKRWLDTANDLAWLLAGDPGSESEIVAPARAILLAEQAVALEPECGTYWNTLGAAYYRAGDWDAAIAALEHAIERNAGGTGFDHYFLAMAHQRRLEPERARAWLDRGDQEIATQGTGGPELLRVQAEAREVLGITPAPLSRPPD